MNILLTGANGFLGEIFKQNLQENIITLGRENNNYNVDLRYSIPKFTHKIDLVIHCLGKAHVRPKTIEEKEDFYRVNVKGTQNLLTGLDDLSIKPTSFIFISSVAVYGQTNGENINEEAPLIAKDAYGHSKILAEKEVEAWGQKNNVSITILRLPLIIGQSPKGNLKKIIDGIKHGLYFGIGSRKQKKSILLGRDLISIIPQSLQTGGIYNLTDDYNPTLLEIERAIMNKYKRKSILVLPYNLVWFLSKIGDLINNIFRKQISPIDSQTLIKLTSTLTFSCEKAKKELGWTPTKAIDYLQQ